MALAARDGQAHRAVADEGIGIPAGQVVCSSNPSPAPPTSRAGPVPAGLGLSIARRVVGRHGGQGWAESVEGQGGTFHLPPPPGRAEG